MGGILTSWWAPRAQRDAIVTVAAIVRTCEKHRQCIVHIQEHASLRIGRR